MLVLSRKKNESIVINDNITIIVVDVHGDKVRIGVEAPSDVTVHRKEVFEAIMQQVPGEISPSPAEIRHRSDTGKNRQAAQKGQTDNMDRTGKIESGDSRQKVQSGSVKGKEESSVTSSDATACTVKGSGRTSTTSRDKKTGTSSGKRTPRKPE